MNNMLDVDCDSDGDDAPLPTEAMLRQAEVRWYKVQAETVIVDSAVLNWFKTQGADYQDRINSILREHMHAHQSKK